MSYPFVVWGLDDENDTESNATHIAEHDLTRPV
jgi:hypothetical protein